MKVHLFSRLDAKFKSSTTYLVPIIYSKKFKTKKYGTILLIS